MRRRLLPLACLIALAGCNRFLGPRETRQLDPVNAPAPDGSRYNIAEQQKRGRERLAVTEDDYRIGPKAFIDRPSPIGR